MSASVTTPRVAIVGAGVAGLVCAIELEKAGFNVEIFEADSRVGGRVRTEIVSGYKLDVGFQILLDAYPEARRQLDYSSLKLRSFGAGAILANAGKLNVIAHPLKCPFQLMGSLRTAISWGLLRTILDVICLMRVVLAWLITSPYEAMESASRVETTASFLHNLGLSSTFVDRFLKPFFEAIYVSPLQEQSSALFNFVLRMLAFGGATLPEQGMGAIPAQLASTLQSRIKLSTPVEAVTSKAVKVAGEWRPYDSVVVAADWPAASVLLGLSLPSPRATRSATWYFGLLGPPPVTEPLIILHSYVKGSEMVGNRVVNIGFPSTVQSSYAPPGHALAAVTVMGPKGAEEAWVRSQVELMLGVDCSTWQTLRTYDIAFHQPAQIPLQLPQDFTPTVDGVYCCGDHRSYPTLDGAMRSGRHIAEAILCAAKE